jgi:KDO2-lipid IV(A) lauroyltransferase
LPEFIAGYPLRKVARKHEYLRRLLWRVDFALLWSLLALTRLLPVDWASALGAKASVLIAPLMSRKTEVLEGNYRIVFPEKSPDEIKQLAKACWSSAFRVLGEYPHLDHIADDRGGERLEIVVRDPETTFHDENRPTVLVGAHLSNWEVTGSALRRLGIANSALYSPPSNPWIDRKLRESREALNSELLPRDNSARPLVQRLSAGRTVGMLVDRRVNAGGKPIPFFGRDKPTSIMPAKLALKFDCDLIPVQVERIRGARFRVTFHPPLRPRNPDDCQIDQAVDMMLQLHQLFESWIRQHPEDWFCPTRIWPKVRSKKPKKARRESG